MTAATRRWERDAVIALAVNATIWLIGRTLDMFPHGAYTPPSVEPVEVWECIQCESTNTCKRTELGSWTTHRLKDGTYVVLCDVCKATNNERRQMREALAKGAAATAGSN
jgi:hypothetical protein